MNSLAPFDPSLLDVVLPPEHQGYPAHLAAEDSIDAFTEACGSASREFPRALWIEPRDWAAKAAENDRYKTWPINYMDRFTNQNPTHECTCHSLRANAEACRNRQRGIIFPDGPKKGERYPESANGSVWLSPLSIYAEANPRERGGANVRRVLDIACRRGFLPEPIQPREYGFRHTLHGTTGKGGINQASGRWTPLNRFPEGWQETAKWFRPDEVILTSDPEQAVCLVLHGYVVSVGRNGHAVPYSFWNAEKRVMGYVDSYDVVRYDSWATVQRACREAFSIASMTTPDSWERPAG